MIRTGGASESDAETQRPAIDIALPVYNGETFLRESIESILAQDLRNFRLIIGDNASTDSTEAICREFADQDDRIVFTRRDTNIGAAPNFNDLFAQSDARYFKWHAADDTMSPTFLSTCIAMLDEDDDTVLAFSRVQVIDADGRVLSVDDPAQRLSTVEPEQRFRDLVHFHRYPCYEIFGVFRSSALVDTDLIGNYSGGDRTLLADVALRGRFAVSEAELFQQRRHDNQSVQMVSDRIKYAEWFDPRNRGRTRFPEWNRYRHFIGVVRRASLSPLQRLRCMGSIAHQALLRRRVLAGDLKRLVVR